MSIVPDKFTGSTQLNPYITTYEGVIKRIKHTLGYPLVEIEVSDEQVIDFINESIEYFSKYAGYTEEFLVFDTKIYSPHTGLQVEKLINSTCTYGIAQSSVSVVDVVPGTYYLYNGSVYLSVSSDEQLTLGRSYQGDVIVSSIAQVDPYSYISNRSVVPLSSNTYYINNSALYQSGESLFDNNNYCVSGLIVQESVYSVTQNTLYTPPTYINVVNVDPGTYYVYNGDLYVSGTTTDSILPDTSNIGNVFQSSLPTPALSTISVDEDVYTVEVPSNTYYITVSGELWKSAPEYISQLSSYRGAKILTSLSQLTPTNISTPRVVNAVSATPHTYYIYEDHLFKSGNKLINDNTVSYTGSLINELLVHVIPDEFEISGSVVLAVPVLPYTVYFNASQGDQLYQSGDFISNNSNYSSEGTLVQADVQYAVPFDYTITTSLTGLTGIDPYQLYLQSSDLWKSGSVIAPGVVGVGNIITSGISQNIVQVPVQVQCSFSVVNVASNTLYLNNNSLMRSGSDCDVPDGWSSLGDVVVESIPIIQSYLQGTVLGVAVNCVGITPNTYYISNNSLYRSGAATVIPGYSEVGSNIQNLIEEITISTLTTVADVVDVPPDTYYVSGVNVYRSGTSTEYLNDNTSEAGEVVHTNITLNPTIIQESKQCLNMYYDGDLASYRKIVDVFTFEQGESTGINTLFTLEQAMAQQIYSSYMIGNFGFDLVTWEVLKGFVETRNKVLAQKPYFRFDNRTQTLRIIPEPRETESYLGLVGCYIERPIKDLIKERWVYDYAKALTMIAVGNTRGKYAGTGLFGGGSVNGGDIRSQGLTEKENLEKVLITEYRDNSPANFFVG